MKFIIHGKQLKVTPAIKSYAEEKIGKLDKYLENKDEITATVVVGVKGKDQSVEVTIPMKKFILRGEVTNNDLYAAIDLVTEKIERQIRKNKTRLKKKPNKDTDFILDFKIDKEEKEDFKIVKRKSIEMKPMSEEEAILQMELLGHEFFIFLNEKTDVNSVIYKRKDNHYGIIELI